MLMLIAIQIFGSWKVRTTTGTTATIRTAENEHASKYYSPRLQCRQIWLTLAKDGPQSNIGAHRAHVGPQNNIRTRQLLSALARQIRKSGYIYIYIWLAMHDANRIQDAKILHFLSKQIQHETKIFSELYFYIFRTHKTYWSRIYIYIFVYVCVDTFVSRSVRIRVCVCMRAPLCFVGARVLGASIRGFRF